VLFDDPKLFMSQWDISWCLGRDFNIVRTPYERSIDSAMMEFSGFINSCGLIDPLLEGGRFTWSSHRDVPVLSHIDRFLFSVEWEGHFQDMHQVILPKITSDHFAILLRMWTTHVAERPFRFEIVWLGTLGGWLM